MSQANAVSPVSRGSGFGPDDYCSGKAPGLKAEPDEPGRYA
jgi:hypothetical protein